MVSDHSSASHLDLMDSDLERSGMVMNPSNVDDSAAASAATQAGFHRCACGRRMSSMTHDYHSFCVHCRGFECNFNNRC